MMMMMMMMVVVMMMMMMMMIDILFTKSCDTTTWPLLIDELASSYQAINPYMVKFGDIKNPLEINAHRKFLNELTLETLPIAGKGGVQHVEDITYTTHSDVQEVSSGVGFANIEIDQDGVLRRLPIIAELNGMLVPHFFLKLLSEHLGYKISNIFSFISFQLSIAYVCYVDMILMNLPVEI